MIWDRRISRVEAAASAYYIGVEYQALPAQTDDCDGGRHPGVKRADSAAGPHAQGLYNLVVASSSSISC